MPFSRAERPQLTRLLPLSRRRSASSMRLSSTTAPSLFPSPTFLLPTTSLLPTRFLLCTPRLSRNRILAVPAPLATAPRPLSFPRPRRTPPSSPATSSRKEHVATATTAPCQPHPAPPAPSRFSPSRRPVSPQLLHPLPLVPAHPPPPLSNAAALPPPLRRSRSTNALPRNRLVRSSWRSAGGANRSSPQEGKPLPPSTFALLCIPTPRSRQRLESRRRGRQRAVRLRPSRRAGGGAPEERSRVVEHFQCRCFFLFSSCALLPLTLPLGWHISWARFTPAVYLHSYARLQFFLLGYRRSPWRCRLRCVNFISIPTPRKSRESRKKKLPELVEAAWNEVKRA